MHFFLILSSVKLRLFSFFPVVYSSSKLSVCSYPGFFHRVRLWSKPLSFGSTFSSIIVAVILGRSFVTCSNHAFLIDFGVFHIDRFRMYVHSPKNLIISQFFRPFGFERSTPDFKALSLFCRSRPSVRSKSMFSFFFQFTQLTQNFM